jgi:hypothetical protein
MRRLGFVGLIVIVAALIVVGVTNDSDPVPTAPNPTPAGIRMYLTPDPSLAYVLITPAP